MILTILPLPTIIQSFLMKRYSNRSKIFLIWAKSSSDFWNKRLLKAEVPIAETISKNNLRLPRHMIDGKIGDAKNPILTPKINQFHWHAYNCTVAPSPTLRKYLQLLQHRLPFQNLVLWLSSLSISYMSCGYEQCDVVADRHFAGSLKEGTRKKRGDDGSTMQFTDDTQFPSNFGDILSNSVNENNINQFLPHKLLVLHGDNSSLKLVVTLNDTILTNINNLLVKNDINYCTADKANPRLIQYAINRAANGLENITIWTFDSHILVLTLSSVKKLIQAGLKRVLIVLVKKNGTEEFILIKIFNKFDADICQVLPFFHAFSGCDTSASFYGKGKSTFWDAWMSYSKSTELTHTFIELSNSPPAISKKNIRLLGLFILYAYFGRNHRYTDIKRQGVLGSLNPPIRSWKIWFYQKMLYLST